MFYYSHHIGDFIKDTTNLDDHQLATYLRLLWKYYSDEKPIAGEIEDLAFALRSDEKTVRLLLRHYFTETPEGWANKRCDEEIEAFKERSVSSSKAAKTRWENAKAKQSQSDRNANASEDNANAHVSDANQEPITNNRKPSTTTSSASGDAPEYGPDDVRLCPVGSIVDLYHELMPLNPRVKVLNETRRRAIRQRWKEAAALDSKPFGYSTRAQGLDAWKRFFEVCAGSEFLTGRGAAQAGRPAFVADIDFLFSPAGFAKILENKYHRAAA